MNDEEGGLSTRGICIAVALFIGIVAIFAATQKPLIVQ